MHKHTPSNVLRYIVKIASKKESPTQREWNDLVAMAENAIAKTVLKYAKEGKQPPELEWFDGESFAQQKTIKPWSDHTVETKKDKYNFPGLFHFST